MVVLFVRIVAIFIHVALVRVVLTILFVIVLVLVIVVLIVFVLIILVVVLVLIILVIIFVLLVLVVIFVLIICVLILVIVILVFIVVVLVSIIVTGLGRIGGLGKTVASTRHALIESHCGITAVVNVLRDSQSPGAAVESSAESPCLSDLGGHCHGLETHVIVTSVLA